MNDQVRPSRFASPLCLALLAAPLAAWACSEATEPEPPPVCIAPVNLHLTPGAAPTITWTPICRATRLFMMDANPDVVPCNGGFWSIGYAPDTAPLLPPLVYPTAPTGAPINRGCQVPLTVGDSVTVTLFVPDAESPDSLAVVASQTFIQ